MAEAVDTYGTALKNGSITLLARVVGRDGDNIVQFDVASIEYSVYLLDDQDADSRTEVEGHTDVALSVSQVIFDTLQLDLLWTVDDLGYNFRHVLDVSQGPAFAVAGRRYLVEHRLTPISGQVILVRFRINVI
jgi:hypothetical protein